MTKKVLFKRAFELEVVVHSTNLFNFIEEIDRAYNYYLRLIMNHGLYKEYLLYIKDRV